MSTFFLLFLQETIIWSHDNKRLLGIVLYPKTQSMKIRHDLPHFNFPHFKCPHCGKDGYFTETLLIREGDFFDCPECEKTIYIYNIKYSIEANFCAEKHENI